MLGSSFKGKYISILDGKISMEVPEGTAGAITRKNKLDRMVHEVKYDFCIGTITSIRIKKSDNYGKSIIVGIKDGDDLYNLQMPYNSRFTIPFLKHLPNIDFSKPVKITPSVKVVEGKNRSTVFLEQDGNTLKHGYTKENPNGLPALEKIIVKGEDQYDDSKQFAFFEEIIKTEYEPVLEKLNGVVSAATMKADQETQHGNIDLDSNEEVEKANSLDEF